MTLKLLPTLLLAFACAACPVECGGDDTAPTPSPSPSPTPTPTGCRDDRDCPGGTCVPTAGRCYERSNVDAGS